MDFLHRAEFSSPLFLHNGAFTSLEEEELVAIQSTLSEDRTAGAKAWEDGAIYEPDSAATTQHISQQKILPGDIDIARSYEVGGNTIEFDDTVVPNHREAAAIIREQLAGNRKYLVDTRQPALDWRLKLFNGETSSSVREIENPLRDLLPLWKVLEVIEYVKEITGKSTLQIIHGLGRVPSLPSIASMETLSSDSIDSSFEEESERRRKRGEEKRSTRNTRSGAATSIERDNDSLSDPADNAPSQRADEEDFRAWESRAKKDRKKHPSLLVRSGGTSPLNSGPEGYRPKYPVMETYFTGHLLREVKYSDVLNTPAVYCIVSEIKCPAAQPYEHHRALMFEDVPFLRARSEAKDPHLEGSRPIQNLAKYMSDRAAGFVVLRWYFCNGENLSVPVIDVHQLRPVIEGGQMPGKRSRFAEPPETREPQVCLDVKEKQDTIERIHITSEALVAKIQSIAKSNPGQLIGYTDGQPRPPLEMHFPYTWTFHSRAKLREQLEKETESLKTLTSKFLEYCESRQGDLCKRAEELFSRGRVTRDIQDFLFQSNEPVVYREQDVSLAYMIRHVEYISWKEMRFDCWSWSSSGTQLKRKKRLIQFQWPKEDEFAIDSLELYPLKYASQDTRELLLQQGKKYWGLRFQHKVEYSGWDIPQDQLHVESRFMIDLLTYSKLHPSSAAFVFSKDPILQYDEYPSEIELDGDLGDLDYILCPHFIQGFYLKEKQWVSLYVSNIEPVKWNKEAFDRLVLPPKTKELIKALLVRTGERSTDQVGVCGGKRQDLIAGKGTGLIVLLHGGPGTGKTLTAESVAELAEMPLYRVTCGDIGTEPEVVETYLKRVLYFGKIWKCVLLIDEADVFLEERGLQDLKRNSLVSIFLRILEYYNGVLILTSNRVGTFDEAFKSRIQLALRYPDPDPPFRQKIWRNFLDMLEADEEDADLEELKEHLDELSDLDMNGREIRNALTTARQLALYKKKTLGWVHLSQAVNAARDFNKYLLDVQGQASKDWARELNLR